MKNTQEEYLAWIKRFDERLELAIAHCGSMLAQPSSFGIVEIKNALIDAKQSNLANRDVLDEKPKAEIQGEFVDRLNERQIGWNLCLEALQKKITNRLDEVMG